MRQCIVVCYLHTFTCVPSMFCHSNTEPPTDSLFHTHTGAHNRLSSMRWKSISKLSHFYFFFFSVRSSSFEVPFTASLFRRLCHCRRAIFCELCWTSNQFKFTCSLLQLTFPCHRMAPFAHAKVIVIREHILSNITRTNSHELPDIVSHVASSFFKRRTQNERREIQYSFALNWKAMWESERAIQKIKHRHDGSGLDFYAD